MSQEQAMIDAEPQIEALRSDCSLVLQQIVGAFVDIREVWSIGHGEQGIDRSNLRLLAFANQAVLDRLKASAAARAAKFTLMVVVDGDNFFGAWGANVRSGSLGRSAWRLASAREAFYDEACWSPGAIEERVVVRVRRHALLVWRRRVL